LADVCLLPINAKNYRECLNLRVEDAQSSFVATNGQSLAEAGVKSNLVPLAIYDRAALGFENPTAPMLGFTMYELTAGVGFILRLMIDRAHQRQGYGRAAMIEVIRRLKLHPEVQLVATSHCRDNDAAARLYRGLGFVEWDTSLVMEDPDELYLMLPE
jgi:diamine N-acetyltransferase